MKIQSAFVFTILTAMLFLSLSVLYLNFYHTNIFASRKRDYRSERDAIKLLMYASIPNERIHDGKEDAKSQAKPKPAKSSRGHKLKPNKSERGDHKNTNPNPGKSFVKDASKEDKPNESSRTRVVVDDQKNISKLSVSIEEVCKEQTNILLLKTHKTGSSTLQNVLYRFGDLRGLTFAMPAVDVYMGSPIKFKGAFAIPSPTGQYNILANHARFHKENMRRVMAPGTKFITILRYPPKQFESMFSYYKMERRFKNPLEAFAASPKTMYKIESERNTRHSSLNPMLYDLGMDVIALDDVAKIATWIQYLDDAFHLVLIAEHLQESLILLKEMMCWSFDDITYFTSNARTGMLVEHLSNETESNLLRWLRGDVRLYQHFNATLWTKIKKYGVERMAADVAELTRRNAELSSRCVQGKKKVSEMGGNTVIERYVLRPEAANDMTCKRITYSAYSYLTSLRHKMNMRRPIKVGSHR